MILFLTSKGGEFFAGYSKGYALVPILGFAPSRRSAGGYGYCMYPAAQGYGGFFSGLLDDIILID
jgi:hypothetical protein